MNWYARRIVSLDCSKLPSKAKQSFKDECDINTIVKRFGLSGKLPTALVMPTYADFEGIFDFQSAMDALNLATDKFMEMPANVRARFYNDPHEFVKFCSDPSNADEAKRLGLVDKAVAPAVVAAAAVAPAASVAAAAAPGTVPT